MDICLSNGRIMRELDWEFIMEFMRYIITMLVIMVIVAVLI